MKPLVRALCVAAAALIVGCGEAEDKADSRRSSAPWPVTGISRDQHTVNLAYEQGGCERDDARVAVQESKTAVKIKVIERVIDPPAGQLCADVQIVDLLKARLRSPLAGRRTVGLRSASFAGPPGPFRRRGSYVVELVPRATGLAVSDARVVLRDYGFSVRSTGAPPEETIETRPGPGAEGTPASEPPLVVRILSKPRG